VKRAGLATHYVPSAALPDLERELRRQGAYMRATAAVNRTIASFEVHSGWAFRFALPSCSGRHTLTGMCLPVNLPDISLGWNAALN